nr:PQQ-dependent sugar dehydrogenase [Chloroflexota bacterium]
MIDRHLPARNPRILARILLAGALAAGAFPAVTLAGDGHADAADTGAAPGAPRGAAPTLTSTVVRSGLVNPWDVAFDAQGRMFVTERPGRIRLYSSGNVGNTLLMTFTVPNVWQVGESGLMGIALDRDFTVNQTLYVCRSRQRDTDEINQVLAYRFTGSTLAFSHWVIQDGMNASTIHNGCAVEHGPDGKLWVTMGDAADAGSAQDPDALNGKVLRV